MQPYDDGHQTGVITQFDGKQGVITFQYRKSCVMGDEDSEQYGIEGISPNDVVLTFPPECTEIPFHLANCNPEKPLIMGEKVRFFIRVHQNQFFADKIRNESLAVLSRAMLEQMCIGKRMDYYEELKHEFNEILSGKKLDYGDFFERQLTPPSLMDKIRSFLSNLIK